MAYAEQIIWLMLSFWESGIWACARKTVPIWLAPNKNSGYWVSNKLPWLAAFHTCWHNSLLGELSMSCVTSLGKDSGSLWLVSPGLCPMCLSFVDFALQPFTIINHSHWALIHAVAWESSWAIIRTGVGLGDCPTQGIFCQQIARWIWIKK